MEEQIDCRGYFGDWGVYCTYFNRCDFLNFYITVRHTIISI